MIESATELMNIAKVLENPKFIQEVDQKNDEIFKDFGEISDEDFSLIHESAGNIALSRLSIREEYYEHAEFFLLQALAKMKTLGFGENIAMCYRLLWNLALISSDFTKSEVWLLMSLEVYQTLGDKSGMTEMCKEVHAGGAVPPEQAVKMKDYTILHRNRFN